jgi:glutathione S-transferase
VRLYHVPNSSSQRVLWLLEEIGEPYELTILGDRASRLADPAHLARHPMGRVPVLEDDGVAIFESGAICLYVADKYPAAGLLPAPGSVERGLVYQWSFFAYTEIQARLQVLRAVEDDSAETTRQQLGEAIHTVEQALSGHDYLVADHFSVADILVSVGLAVARRLGLIELPEQLGRYLDAMDERPAKQRSNARNPVS